MAPSAQRLIEAATSSTSGGYFLSELSQRAPLTELVRKGIPYESVVWIGEALEITSDITLSQLLGISLHTLKKRKRLGVFTQPESDRIVRLVRLFDLAVQVFEGEAEARLWLKTPNDTLGGESPLEYASTETGARRVEEILYTIEYTMAA